MIFAIDCGLSNTAIVKYDPETFLTEIFVNFNQEVCKNTIQESEKLKSLVEFLDKNLIKNSRVYTELITGYGSSLTAVRQQLLAYSALQTICVIKNIEFIPIAPQTIKAHFGLRGLEKKSQKDFFINKYKDLNKKLPKSKFEHIADAMAILEFQLKIDCLKYNI